MDALLKRATWIVNTTGSIYVRLAGVTSGVRVYDNEGPTLGHDAAAIWTKWLRNNEKRDEEDFLRAQAGEQILLRRLLRKTDLHSNDSLPGGEGPHSDNATEMVMKEEPQILFQEYCTNAQVGVAHVVDLESEEDVSPTPSVSVKTEVVMPGNINGAQSSSSSNLNPSTVVDVQDSPPRTKRLRCSTMFFGKKVASWAGATITDKPVYHVPGSGKCIPTSLVSIAKLTNDPCSDLLDVCFDDEDGPFSFKRIMQKSPDVHFKAAIYRRGIGQELSNPSRLRKELRRDGSYAIYLGGHVVCISCNSLSVFIADSHQQNILVTSTLQVIRELALHDSVAVFPVVFEDIPDDCGMSSSDVALSAGGSAQLQKIMKKPAASILAPGNGVGTQTHGTVNVPARGTRTTFKKRPTATIPASFSNWPKKRGKARQYGKHKTRSPKLGGEHEVPYVRHGEYSRKNRSGRVFWKRDIPSLMLAPDEEIINILIADEFLPTMEGAVCPRCRSGILGKLTKHPSRSLSHRCNNRDCVAYVRPHDSHPLFWFGRGEGSESLQHQSAALFCLIGGASQSLISILFGINHKRVESLSKSLDTARCQYVQAVERFIQFGGEEYWVDVEADEVDLAKGLSSTDSATHNTSWEQWCGVVQRGVPRSLRLFRLNPASTCARSPGPGPIRKVEWEMFATEHLQNRRVILHTDGARSYKSQVPGLCHDHVVHMKKPITVKGKRMWLQPFFSKVFTHSLPDGDCVKCRGGTQIIDRFWRTLRASLVGRAFKVGSVAYEVRIRSCQWNYWNQGTDRWVETGRMLAKLRELKAPEYNAEDGKCQ